MIKIDTSTWKPFRVGDLFEVKRGKSRIMRELNNGDVPLIAAARAEQGVAGIFDIESEYADAITVSCNGAGCGSTFYHAGAFAITGDASVLLEKLSMSQLVKMFITSILDGRLSQIYSYAEKCGPATLSDEVILLPATLGGEPDWAYMERYMRDVMSREEIFAEHLASLTAEAVADGHVIDTSCWKAFRMFDLGFVVYHGQRLNKAQRIDGNVPFVTAGFENRGITQFIGNDRPVYRKAITVDMFGNCFFQVDDCAGDDNVYFFVNDDMPDIIKLFVSVSIGIVTAGQFDYTRQFRQGDADSLMTMLPATPDGDPDWAYMERYMKSVMECEAMFADELDKLVM